MPVALKQHDIETITEPDIATPTAPRRRLRRRAAHSTGSAIRWDEWESLVQYFGEAAVAEEAPQQVLPQARPNPIPEDAPKGLIKTRAKHRSFRCTLAAFVMWTTLLGLMLTLLTLHATTLALSQQDVRISKEIKLTRESIDNTKKSLAAIQVSPELSQWALANGWHVADQTDFDQISMSETMPLEAGAQR